MKICDNNWWNIFLFGQGGQGVSPVYGAPNNPYQPNNYGY